MQKQLANIYDNAQKRDIKVDYKNKKKLIT